MVLHDLTVLFEANQLPSWMPLLVAIVMVVALAWLWGSMRMHLKRADYPDPPEDGTVTLNEAETTSPTSPESAPTA